MSQAESATESAKHFATQASTTRPLIDLALTSREESTWKKTPRTEGSHLDFGALSELSVQPELRRTPECFVGMRQNVPKRDQHEEELARDGSKAALDKDYKGAEKKYKELLDYRTKKYGEESAEVAKTLDQLGSACASDGRYTNAKDYYKKGQEVCAKVYGKDNFETGAQAHSAATMDEKLKNWAQAAANFKEAIRIYEKNNPSGDNHSMNESTRALNQYAEVLMQLGDKKGADAQRERAKEIYETYLRAPRRTLEG